MPKFVKWSVITIVVLVLLCITALFIAIQVVDVQQFKPQIETAAAKALNRPVTLGGELSPSLFPWIGIAMTDVHIGNPPGFKEKNFVSVQEFEARVKLMPLLEKKVEIKRFVVKEPSVTLIKNRNGVSNLDGIGKSSDATPKAKETSPGTSEKSGKPLQLPVQSFEADEFAITNAQVLIIDEAAASRKEIKNINLVLSDLTLDRPVGIELSAEVDQMPLSVTGKVGPIGSDPGKNPLPLDLMASLLKQLDIQIKGRINTPLETPEVQMQIQVAQFSPRKLLSALNQKLPMEPADPAVLNKAAFGCTLSGTPKQITFSKGTLNLDDSQMTFQGHVREFDKPNLKLEAQLDRIDIDRYLPPPPPKKESSEDHQKQPAPQKSDDKTDYTPLRKLLLDAGIQVGTLKAKNVKMHDILLKATAKNGIFRLDPLDVGLYQGQITSRGTVDIQKDQPDTKIKLAVKQVHAGPLIKDFMDKKIIEGVASAAMELSFSGDQPDLIRKTLGGNGQLTFQDGAIVGIDLANMVRNVQSAFGMTEKPKEKPRTDFSELMVPFSIAKGRAKLNDAKLISPLLRVAADGKVNLVKQNVDIYVNPKFVATLKGQGDTEKRSGIMVPVNIKGKFDDLRFEPDIGSILKQPGVDTKAIQKILPDQKEIEKIVPPEEEIKDELEKKAQELFKGLPFGQPEKKKK